MAPFRRVRPWQWLALMVATYFAISLAFSILRYVEILTTNWDLGIFMQALWSSSHGHLLYEAGDYEFYGASTLLQVHTAFILLLVVPIYAAAPSPVTLFALQSLVIALAGIPLYRITEILSGSPRRALLAVGIYFVWAPTLSSNLYDVHLEALLPLEFLTVFLLWLQGRYLWGAMGALVSFATIEVAPILMFAIAIFFLLPPIRSTLRRAMEVWRATGDASPWGALWTRSMGALRRALGRPRIQASLALAVGALAAYYALRYLQFNSTSLFLGHTSSPVATEVGLTPGSLGFALSNGSASFYTKLGYWLLLFATLAFIPMRVPRTALLVGPWVLFTFFGTPLNTYVILGQQYGLVAAGPMMAAFALGLCNLPLTSVGEAWRAWWRAAPQADTPVTAPSSMASWRLGGAAGPVPLWTVALVAAIAVNILASPADPAMQDQGLGNGYVMSYTVDPGFDQVQEVAQMVPAGATVLSSDNLFPFVANDVHAYSLLWTPGIPNVFPFSPTDLPPYVFVAQDRFFAVPGWLVPDLFNGTDYGVRATVGTQSVGVVYLFELGYHGTPTNLLPPSFPKGLYPARSLAVGPIGFQVPSLPTPAAYLDGLANTTGLVWMGPSVTLTPGSYSVTFTVRAQWDRNLSGDLAAAVPEQSHSPSPPPAGVPVLSLNVSATGLTTQRTTLDWGALSSGAWENFTMSFSVGYPCMGLQFTGYQWNPAVQVQVMQVAVLSNPLA